MEQAAKSHTQSQEAAQVPFDMEHPSVKAMEYSLRDAQQPTAEGRTAAQYVADMKEYHEKQYPDRQPPAFLKWIGNAALAVPPKARLEGAMGLVGGLIVGGITSNALTGFKITGEKVEKPLLSFLRPIGKKIFNNFDPKGLETHNKYTRFFQVAAYSFFGGWGAKLGAEHAYHDRVEKSKNPQFLEDYLNSVSQLQGNTWGYMAALSATLASSSGMWLWALAVPPLNYGEGLVGFITSRQDRNTMLPFLNHLTSGATTSSYLRLKEGSHYLCEYAVGNPAKEPANIEYLAYTILGPLFREKLTAEHIQEFTAAVQAVRMKFWEEGGIPKSRRKEALHTMKEIFTGAGLEVLMIDMGLNPAAVAFDHINGLIGQMGDIGQKENIQKAQESFWNALQTRIPKYVAAGEISKERADWVVAGIEAMRHKQKVPDEPAHETFNEVASKQDIEQAIGKSDIRIESDNSLSRNQRFASNSDVSFGASIRRGSIRHLLETATTAKGDWRESVLDNRQDMESPMVID